MHSTTRGTIVTWKNDKAYGFIRPAEGGRDVFVHLRDFGRIAREPRVGDVVSFQKMSDGTGKVRAADVSIQGMQRHVSRPRQSVHLAPSTASLAVALAYFTAIAWLVARHGLPMVVPGVFLAASLVAFLMYAFDKAAAMNRRWRTRESTLLLAGLMGGWPGALVAQGMFRHKSSKASFQAAFWMTVVLNCAALAWWCFFRASAAQPS
jgi:uncharacterized membrane protein YsdA (DUF1294 family)/cold shock CspA family protein